jgi:exosortase K
MFIDTAMNLTTRAPEERNVSGDKIWRAAIFRTSGAKRIFGSLRSINIASLRDDGVGGITLSRKEEVDGLFHSLTYTHIAQLVAVLLGALTLKLYYSTASADQLRWILAPTTFLVELIGGTRFEFESHAGYISSDRSFLIAVSCAGVNFLITSFLMLSLRKLWRDRSLNLPWKFIPATALLSYLATLVANTVRISTALQLRRIPLEISWLDRNQLHRFEGIFIYFGFLLLLFMVSERMSSKTASGLPGYPRVDTGLFRKYSLPLLIYYATTLGIPLANGAYRGGIAATDFWQHFVFVLLTPLLLILPLATFRFLRDCLRYALPSR